LKPRRFTELLVILITVSALAACGGGSEPESPGDATRSACEYAEPEITKLNAGHYNSDRSGWVKIARNTSTKAEDAWPELSSAADEMYIASSKIGTGTSGAVQRASQATVWFGTLCTGYRNTNWVR